MIEQLASDLGLSNVDVARTMDVSVRTIERWRSGLAYPQTEARQRLATLVVLRSRLLETFATIEAGREWLWTGNRYLGGLSPVDALRTGHIDRVDAALEALDSGIFI